MWAQLIIAIFVSCLIVYIPGYFLFRGVGIKPLEAFTFAPFASISLVAFIPIFYAKLGVQSSFASILAPVIILSIAAFLIRKIRTQKTDERVFQRSLLEQKAVAIDVSLCICVGFLATCFIFLSQIQSADAFNQSYDNMFHLGVVRGFLDSGNWSSLEASTFMTAEDIAISPLHITSGFYPSAWHVVCALVVQITGCSIAVASNSVNTLVCAVIFPLSIFSFLRTLDAENHVVIRLGAFASVTQAAFPWAFITHGPLYPNLLSMSMLMAFLGLFILATKNAEFRTIEVYLFPLVLALVFFLLVQPNTAFSAAILLAPYCTEKIFEYVANKQSKARGYICASLFVMIVLAAWCAIYKSPITVGVMGDLQVPTQAKSSALASLLVLDINQFGPQYLVMIALIVGVFTLIVRGKDRWMVFSLAIAAIFYFVSVACSETGFPKRFLTCLWYGDPYRLSALLAIMVIPLSSIGAGTVFQKIFSLFQSRAASAITASLTACILLLSPFIPVTYALNGAVQKSGVAYQQNLSKEVFSESSSQVLSKSEIDFANEALSIVGANDIVLNEPDDGSGFLYGIDGMRTYYRNTRPYGTDSETGESSLIRSGLSSIQSNEDVRKAVENLNAHYVLLLDQGDNMVDKDGSGKLFTWDWYSYQWEGLRTITDDTPGFEVVLSEGDMRLYRITA